MPTLQEGDTVLFRPENTQETGTVTFAVRPTVIVERRGERYVRHRDDVTLVPREEWHADLRSMSNRDRVTVVHSAPSGSDSARYHQSPISVQA